MAGLAIHTEKIMPFVSLDCVRLFDLQALKRSAEMISDTE